MSDTEAPPAEVSETPPPAEEVSDPAPDGDTPADDPYERALEDDGADPPRATDDDDAGPSADPRGDDNATDARSAHSAASAGEPDAQTDGGGQSEPDAVQVASTVTAEPRDQPSPRKSPRKSPRQSERQSTGGGSSRSRRSLQRDEASLSGESSGEGSDSSIHSVKRRERKAARVRRRLLDKMNDQERELYLEEEERMRLEEERRRKEEARLEEERLKKGQGKQAFERGHRPTKPLADLTLAEIKAEVKSMQLEHLRKQRNFTLQTEKDRVTLGRKYIGLNKQQFEMERLYGHCSKTSKLRDIGLATRKHRQETMDLVAEYHEHLQVKAEVTKETVQLNKKKNRAKTRRAVKADFNRIQGLGADARQDHADMLATLRNNERLRSDATQINRDMIEESRRKGRQAKADHYQSNRQMAIDYKEHHKMMMKIGGENDAEKHEVWDNFKNSLNKSRENFAEKKRQMFVGRQGHRKSCNVESQYCTETRTRHDDMRKARSMDNQERFKAEKREFYERETRKLKAVTKENTVRKKKLQEVIQTTRRDELQRIRDMKAFRYATAGQAKIERDRKLMKEALADYKDIAQELNTLDYIDMDRQGDFDNAQNQLEDESGRRDEKVKKLTHQAETEYQSLVHLLMGAESIEVNDEANIPHGGMWEYMKIAVREEGSERAMSDPGAYRQHLGEMDGAGTPDERANISADYAEDHGDNEDTSEALVALERSHKEADSDAVDDGEAGHDERTEADNGEQDFNESDMLVSHPPSFSPRVEPVH